MNISENFSVPASGPTSIGSSGHQKRRRHEVVWGADRREQYISSMKYSDQTTKHLNVKPAVSETSSLAPALNYFNHFNSDLFFQDASGQNLLRLLGGPAASSNHKDVTELGMSNAQHIVEEKVN